MPCASGLLALASWDRTVERSRDMLSMEAWMALLIWVISGYDIQRWQEMVRKSQLCAGRAVPFSPAFSSAPRTPRPTPRPTLPQQAAGANRQRRFMEKHTVLTDWAETTAATSARAQIFSILSMLGTCTAIHACGFGG